jgi:hypothetical protein
MQATNVLLLTGFKKKESQITRVKKILKITPVSKTTCENYGLFFVFVFLNSFFFNFFF